MNFTYTYKDQTGARREAVLSADSRAEVFAILKAKGITPLSVREGGKVESAAPKTMPGWVRGAVAGVLIVVAASVGWMVLKNSTSGAPATQSEGKSVPKRKSTKEASPVVRNAAEVSVAAKTELGSPTASNADATIQDEPPAQTNEAQTAVATSKGPRPTFKTGVEQVMSWIFTTELGSAPPPLPNLSRKDMQNIVAILLSKNEVSEEDSEKVAMAKDVVEQAKKELKQYLKDGGDPQSFLSFYHGELKKAHAEWQDAQKLVMQTIKEDGAEVGVALAKELDKRLAEKGIKPVKIPPKYRKAE